MIKLPKVTDQSENCIKVPAARLLAGKALCLCVLRDTCATPVPTPHQGVLLSGAYRVLGLSIALATFLSGLCSEAATWTKPPCPVSGGGRFLRTRV